MNDTNEEARQDVTADVGSITETRALGWMKNHLGQLSGQDMTDAFLGLCALLRAERAMGTDDEQQRVLKRIDGTGPGDELELLLKAYMRGLHDGTNAGVKDERERVVTNLRTRRDGMSDWEHQTAVSMAGYFERCAHVKADGT